VELGTDLYSLLWELFMKNIQLKNITKLLVLSSLVSSPIAAYAYDAGDLLVRGRIINVAPNDSSGTVTTNGAFIAADTGANVNDDTTIELDFTYMLSKNLGVELILGSSEHDANATGATLTGLGLGKLFDARTLPPTLTLQYHFMPDAAIQPYAGIGVNYTIFFDKEATGSAEAILGKTSVDIDDSYGLSAQIGADIDIGNNWFVNLDVKYIDMDTEVTLKTAGAFGKLKVDVDIDPWIFGIGIGTRF
jgi:outer membrane protein